jgi:hypothetical protein
MKGCVSNRDKTCLENVQPATVGAPANHLAKTFKLHIHVVVDPWLVAKLLEVGGDGPFAERFHNTAIPEFCWEYTNRSARDDRKTLMFALLQTDSFKYIFVQKDETRATVPCRGLRT